MRYVKYIGWAKVGWQWFLCKRYSGYDYYSSFIIVFHVLTTTHLVLAHPILCKVSLNRNTGWSGNGNAVTRASQEPNLVFALEAIVQCSQ